MGGKSTYLRQAALIAILAQMGSFVPAESALLPIVDRVFTRIGASDNLARGRSTFMVEMTETAVILNTATPRSLIVLDEIGRGTATYDGLALAWAVIEHIHAHIRAKTLFATHYHELTELAGQLDGVRNLHVSVKEAGDQIMFLRRVEPGAADRSYGIEVARLAALPMSVIERAREVLALHEASRARGYGRAVPRTRPQPMQISLFEPVNYEIAERIRKLNMDELRPIEALAAAGGIAGRIEKREHESGRGDERHVARWHRRRHRGHARRADRSRWHPAATPYPRGCAPRCLAVSNASHAHGRSHRGCNFLLGELYARASRKPAVAPRTARIVDLIGCHGQTIFHEGEPVAIPRLSVASTMQIGEAAVIAERTACR